MGWRPDLLVFQISIFIVEIPDFLEADQAAELVEIGNLVVADGVAFLLQA